MLDTEYDLNKYKRKIFKKKKINTKEKYIALIFLNLI